VATKKTHPTSDGALLEEARRLASRSQSSPDQRAGAVVILSDGSRHAGATFHLRGAAGLSACAAEVAVCAARSACSAPITRIALWVRSASPDKPCGKCLQICRELAPDAGFVMQRGNSEAQVLDLDALLPDAFTHFGRPQ
jgi:cytidine deaminase